MSTTRIPKGLERAEIWAHTLNPYSWQGFIEETYTGGKIKVTRGEFPYLYRGHRLKTRLEECKAKPINESFVINFLDEPAEEPQPEN